MADNDDFLSRWSRRKRAVLDEDQPPAPSEPLPLEDDLPEPVTEEDEAALLEKLGLPAPETLSEGDDFTAFMKAGVPQFLRKRALRVLWRSNPVLANLDGLNDYDEDFNSPELTRKVLATGYQVGRGFVKQILEPDEEAPPDDLADTIPAEEAEVAETPVIAEVSAQELTEETSQEVDEGPAFRPRRMRFET